MAQSVGASASGECRAELQRFEPTPSYHFLSAPHLRYPLATARSCGCQIVKIDVNKFDLELRISVI